MLTCMHGTLGCQVCVKIPAQQPPQTSPKVAQLILPWIDCNSIRISSCCALVLTSLQLAHFCCYWLLACLMGQYSFARCRLSASSVVACHPCGRSADAGPGTWPVRRPTLHGGTVRLRSVRATPCFVNTDSVLFLYSTSIVLDPLLVNITVLSVWLWPVCQTELSCLTGSCWARAERTRETEEEGQDSATEGAGNVPDSEAEGGQETGTADAGGCWTERWAVIVNVSWLVDLWLFLVVL